MNEKEFQEQFAKRLRDTIDRRLLTRMARQVGCHPNTLGSWMKGRFPDAIRLLAELSECLHVDLHWLITGKTGKEEQKKQRRFIP